jgi:hypothetical protein
MNISIGSKFAQIVAETRAETEASEKLGGDLPSFDAMRKSTADAKAAREAEGARLRKEADEVKAKEVKEAKGAKWLAVASAPLASESDGFTKVPKDHHKTHHSSKYIAKLKRADQALKDPTPTPTPTPNRRSSTRRRRRRPARARATSRVAWRRAAPCATRRRP